MMFNIAFWGHANPTGKLQTICMRREHGRWSFVLFWQLARKCCLVCQLMWCVVGGKITANVDLNLQSTSTLHCFQLHARDNNVHERRSSELLKTQRDVPDLLTLNQYLKNYFTSTFSFCPTPATGFHAAEPPRVPWNASFKRPFQTLKCQTDTLVILQTRKTFKFFLTNNFDNCY